MESPVAVERQEQLHRGFERPLSAADARMRRVLRVGDAPPASEEAARSAFGKSMAVSAVRCTLTYVMLPLLKPVLDLTGGVGPALGLVVGAVSMVAIVVALRRFWSSVHRWRWGYTVVGGGVLLLLVVSAVDDIVSLAT